MAPPKLTQYALLRAVKKTGPTISNSEIRKEINRSSPAVSVGITRAVAAGFLRCGYRGKKRHLRVTRAGERFIADFSTKMSRYTTSKPPTRHPGGKKPRLCLKCEKNFMSSGINNRICGPCKGTEDWQSCAAAVFVMHEAGRSGPVARRGRAT